MKKVTLWSMLVVTLFLAVSYKDIRSVIHEHTVLKQLEQYYAVHGRYPSTAVGMKWCDGLCGYSTYDQFTYGIGYKGVLGIISYGKDRVERDVFWGNEYRTKVFNTDSCTEVHRCTIENLDTVHERLFQQEQNREYAYPTSTGWISVTYPTPDATYTFATTQWLTPGVNTDGISVQMPVVVRRCNENGCLTNPIGLNFDTEQHSEGCTMLLPEFDPEFFRIVHTEKSIDLYQGIPSAFKEGRYLNLVATGKTGETTVKYSFHCPMHPQLSEKKYEIKLQMYAQRSVCDFLSGECNSIEDIDAFQPKVITREAGSEPVLLKYPSIVITSVTAASGGATLRANQSLHVAWQSTNILEGAKVNLSYSACINDCPKNAIATKLPATGAYDLPGLQAGDWYLSVELLPTIDGFTPGYGTLVHIVP